MEVGLEGVMKKLRQRLGQQVGGIVSEPAPASTTTRPSSQLAAADASVSDGVRSSGANEVRDLMDQAAAVVATQQRGEPIRQDKSFMSAITQIGTRTKQWLIISTKHDDDDRIKLDCHS
eukprot:scaffold49402_cov53-Attheya_sp.AAC.2